MVGRVIKVQFLALTEASIRTTLEEEMVTHCSILAWKILWIEEPGRL